jgi:hypothetical protein
VGEFGGKHCQIFCPAREDYVAIGFCNEEAVGKACRKDQLGLAVCAPRTYTHPPGVENPYSGCACGDDQYIAERPVGRPHICKALTVCDASEYEWRAPTTTEDRVCEKVQTDTEASQFISGSF